MNNLDFLTSTRQRPDGVDQPLLVISLQKSAKPDEPSASHYLVVGDKDDPSTWHLPTHSNGKPDHARMGAAHAALTGGYRGHRYEGPGKETAMAKLKALYKKENLAFPGDYSHHMDVESVHGEDAQKSGKSNVDYDYEKSHDAGNADMGDTSEAAQGKKTQKAVDSGSFETLDGAKNNEGNAAPGSSGDTSSARGGKTVRLQDQVRGGVSTNVRPPAGGDSHVATAAVPTTSFAGQENNGDPTTDEATVDDGPGPDGPKSSVNSERATNAPGPVRGSGFRKATKDAEDEEREDEAAGGRIRKSGPINYDPSAYAGNAAPGHEPSRNAPGAPHRNFYVRADYAGNVDIGVEQGPSFTDYPDNSSFYERADYQGNYAR